MKTAHSIVSVLSTLMMAFTLICGFWIRFAGSAVTDPAGSAGFHMGMAIVTGVLVLASTILTLIRK